jgi:hypothetical protein
MQGFLQYSASFFSGVMPPGAASGRAGKLGGCQVRCCLALRYFSFIWWTGKKGAEPILLSCPEGRTLFICSVF